MNYVPQPWLADWSALTDEIVKANEEGEDNMATGEYKQPIYVTSAFAEKNSRHSEKMRNIALIARRSYTVRNKQDTRRICA